MSDRNAPAALDFLAYRHGGRSPREQDAYMVVRDELANLRLDLKNRTDGERIERAWAEDYKAQRDGLREALENLIATAMRLIEAEVKAAGPDYVGDLGLDPLAAAVEKARDALGGTT